MPSSGIGYANAIQRSEWAGFQTPPAMEERFPIKKLFVQRRLTINRSFAAINDHNPFETESLNLTFLFSQKEIWSNRKY